jgi:hypothetical protein
MTETIRVTANLEDTCRMVGRRFGVSRMQDESVEAYRKRLIETCDVASIEPGNVRLVGQVETVDIDFTWGPL